MKALSLPITADRLRLRPFNADDVDDVYAYQGLKEVARYLYRPPRTRERCAEIIANSPTTIAWDTDGDSASVRLYERLGMRREAHLVENDLDPEGRWGSEYVYAALKSDLRR
ncbi:MAG TPA: GNAT family N-acetyltransferase [Micromonospora sp.]|nr:GNAT family N-acetyltransferase [Micromonospora sp.]